MIRRFFLRQYVRAHLLPFLVPVTPANLARPDFWRNLTR